MRAPPGSLTEEERIFIRKTIAKIQAVQDLLGEDQSDEEGDVSVDSASKLLTHTTYDIIENGVAPFSGPIDVDDVASTSSVGVAVWGNWPQLETQLNDLLVKSQRGHWTRPSQNERKQVCVKKYNGVSWVEAWVEENEVNEDVKLTGDSRVVMAEQRNFTLSEKVERVLKVWGIKDKTCFLESALVKRGYYYQCCAEVDRYAKLVLQWPNPKKKVDREIAARVNVMISDLRGIYKQIYDLLQDSEVVKHVLKSQSDHLTTPGRQAMVCSPGTMRSWRKKSSRQKVRRLFKMHDFH